MVDYHYLDGEGRRSDEVARNRPDGDRQEARPRRRRHLIRRTNGAEESGEIALSVEVPSGAASSSLPMRVTLKALLPGREGQEGDLVVQHRNAWSEPGRVELEAARLRATYEVECELVDEGAYASRRARRRWPLAARQGEAHMGEDVRCEVESSKSR